MRDQRCISFSVGLEPLVDTEGAVHCGLPATVTETGKMHVYVQERKVWDFNGIYVAVVFEHYFDANSFAGPHVGR